MVKSEHTILGTEPLTLVVGVKNHLEVVNLLMSIDENIEVILVLNNSSPESIFFIKNLRFKRFKLKLVEVSISNLGYVKNTGIQEAGNNNVLLLDADCTLKKNTLRKIIDYFRKDENQIGKANILIETEGLTSYILSKNRVSHKNNAAYTPGLFFRKSIIDKIGGFYYLNDLPWREDYELKRRIDKFNVKINFLEDCIIYHPPYNLFLDLRTAFRCGGGHQIACEKGYILPTIKWGGGETLISAVFYDLYRIPYLLTSIFYEDIKKFGLLASVYKIIWKIIFTLGFYWQGMFDFLNNRNEKLYY